VETRIVHGRTAHRKPCSKHERDHEFMITLLANISRSDRLLARGEKPLRIAQAPFCLAKRLAVAA
jgi:hypothetical protein